MKIVFMGTPEFAIPSLKLIHSCDMVDIIAVVTQPDRPAGRGKKLKASPTKEFALEHGINVLQPEKIRKDQEVLDFLRTCNADAFVTVAFGQILSKEILDMPKLGTVNLHASLLPDYRGPNPIQWSIINGDEVTGVTTMLTDVGVDSGDMLLKQEMPISLDTNAEVLTRTMASLGARVLLDTILGLYENSIKPTPQEHEKATKAPKLNKEDGKIDWTNPTIKIHNLIRGTRPWPGAYTFFNGDLLKVHASYMNYLYDDDQEKTPGVIKEIDNKSIKVFTGDGYIELHQVQPPNKPAMKAVDWARGARVKPGDKFDTDK